MVATYGPWPPGAPATSVTFAAVKAALALASSPVGFNNQRLTGIAAPVADTDGANRLYVFNRSTESFVPVLGKCQHVAAPVALPATTGTHSIPGPAAGFIRALMTCCATSGGATPSYNITLQPSGLVLARALSDGAGTAASVNLPAFSSGIFLLGAGETLQIDNVGTAASVLWYTYADFPSTNRTLVRAQYSNTPVEVVPAAPAGFYRTMLCVSRMFAPTTAWSPTEANFIFNDDTAGAITQLSYGGTVIVRNGNTAANTAGGFASGLTPDLTVTTVPMSISTVVPVTLRQVAFLGCYETFAGTP